MASLFGGGANSDDELDWMQEGGCTWPQPQPAAPPPKAPETPSAAEVPQPAALQKAMSNAAWKAWTTPQPCSEQSGEPAAKKPKASMLSPPHSRVMLKEWNQHASLAATAAKKAAETSEIAVRLAQTAVRQMAETAANNLARKSLETPTKRMSSKRAVPSPESDAKLPIAAAETAPAKDGAAKAAAAKDAPTAQGAAEEAAEEAAVDAAAEDNNSEGLDLAAEGERQPKKSAKGNEAASSRASRGSAGTFAGRRPPGHPDLQETFNLSKGLYTSTREALLGKYPGKRILIGKTATQVNWWNHMRAHVKKAAPKGSAKPTQATQQLLVAHISFGLGRVLLASSSGCTIIRTVNAT